MRVALSIEVTDQQRLRIANYCVPKPTKRLATRDEVRNWLLGRLADLDSSGTPEPTPPPTHSDVVPGESDPFKFLSPEDRETARKLLKDGHPLAYIRGFIGPSKFKRRTP